MTISDSLREHSGHHVGDDFRLMRDAADEIERLREMLTVTAERIDKLANEIPPPNAVTPRLMMVAIGIRHELSRWVMPC
jgi:hypothetical protein